MGYQIKLWVGAFIFGFGVFSLTWFIRNAFKSNLDKPLYYRKYYPVVHVVGSAICIALGLLIYPTQGTMLIIPLVLGIAIGLYISRSASNNVFEKKEKREGKVTPDGLAAAIFMAMVNNEKDIETILENFSSKNIDDVKLELKFLKVFSAFHLIITTVQDSTLRDEIAEAFYLFLFSKSSENYFGCPFESISEKFGTRFNKYHDALSEQNPNGPPYSIGKQFAKFIGHENDVDITFRAATFFVGEIKFKSPILEKALNQCS